MVVERHDAEDILRVEPCDHVRKCLLRASERGAVHRSTAIQNDLQRGPCAVDDRCVGRLEFDENGDLVGGLMCDDVDIEGGGELHDLLLFPPG